MTDTLHVHSLEVTNFMKVEAFHCVLDGDSVILKGKNAQGKSSIINAIWELFATDRRNRQEPIHEGADKSIIRMVLINDAGEEQYVLEKHITKGGERLVITAGGTKVKATKSLMESFLDEYSIDPVGFLSMRPQDQLDMILQVCGIKPPVQQVQLVVGQTPLSKAEYQAIQAKQGESADTYMARLSADETGLFFVKRLNEGREVERLHGAIAKQKEEVEAKSKELATTHRPIEAIQADLKVAREAAAEYEKFIQQDTKLHEIAQQCEQKVDRFKHYQDTRATEIAELKKKLAKLEAEQADDAVDLSNAEVERDEAINLAQEHTAIVALSIDPRPDVEAFEKQLNAAIADTKKQAVIEEARNYLTRLATDHENAKAKHLETETILNDLRALRKSIMEGVNLGVAGLSVLEGKLRYNNKPFLQASDAERIEVACAVATLRNPRLKILRVDRGESLDDDTRRKVIELAAARGWQVIMAVVAKNSGVQVEIVQGE